MMKKLTILGSVVLLSACSMTNNVTGTYSGILPCADCDKIDAKLVLNKDYSYVYETTYFKNKKTHDYIEQGKFSWDKEKSDIIVLDDNAGNLRFKANTNYVEMCDKDGNVATTSNLNYKLLRVATKQKIK
ncbi:copper resistance protein NlpE [Pasteurella atlantica]|uniref:Copper resistance protein NlpE n=2 Tax=Pasteurellaceae TaxID=712 RepID=A0ACC6HKZ3_9PAST|nr:copper resistance protein NlpE [Pasteurella atlantica]MDP8051326.1 copper resistance protein NlpE [Pasteurella atlantica]MDP8099717.1 copper resistance protein NlpE [Pasteurella atlantica]MDP8100323.1 copper resistance protein NlpE [Pasteurella atlantica]MDP8104621.1 copper resistance protein NlpE [Pasteurella atlantica]MDP8107787.1 copper resistance protein NlpE [Pasteurella atlantica]